MDCLLLWERVRAVASVEARFVLPTLREQAQSAAAALRQRFGPASEIAAAALLRPQDQSPHMNCPLFGAERRLDFEANGPLSEAQEC
jgi:hypothetical protein